MNHRIETAWELGRAGVKLDSMDYAFRAANALQRSNEADCSICPEAWTKELSKRSTAAVRRLVESGQRHGEPLKVEIQEDPRGWPLKVNGVSIKGKGFTSAWFERAERAAYAERSCAK